MFWAEIWKISEFLSENFQFLEVKFSIYLNRHVFVMSIFFVCASVVPLVASVLFLFVPYPAFLWCPWKAMYLDCGISWLFPITKTRLFKYIETFTSKKPWKLLNKKLRNFSYFCSKHRLWVLVRTARRGSSDKYSQSMFLSKIKKNNVYPCKPQFYYTKVGFKGIKII